MEWSTVGVGLMTVDRYLKEYQAPAEKIKALEEEVSKLTSLVAELTSLVDDLENSMDDLPTAEMLYKAIQELQGRINAPASELVYYLR